MNKPLFTLLISLIIGIPLSSCTLPLIWEMAPAPYPTVPPPGVDARVTKDTLPAPSPETIQTNTSTPELEITETPSSRFPIFIPTPKPVRFVLQPGSPQAVPNFNHPEFGCDWLGVGGQVFDSQGKLLKSLVVEVGGTLAGVHLRLLGVTGGMSGFGEGGYEVKLADQPLGSEKTLWVQVYDLAGFALSEKVYFDTYAACDRNLTLVNFVELPGERWASYFPMIKIQVP